MIEKRLRSAVQVAVVVTTDVAVLRFALPQVATLRLLVDRPGVTIAELGPDRTVAVCAGAALWLVAAWVAVGLLASVGSTLPGTLGRTCAAVGRVAVPRTVQRIVGVALGIGIVAGPATAAAASRPAVHYAATQQTATHQAAATHHPATQRPAPGWPVTPSGPSRPTPADAPPPMTPGAPHISRTPHAQHSPTTQPTSTGETQVRVRTGDSLWLIAARRLPDHPSPGEVAAYWPRVYAANRAVVGPHPDHITPGLLLRLPDPADSR